MKATRILSLRASTLRPVALSLALLGAGLAFTTAQTARAESIGAGDSALVAADGSRVDAADAPAAGVAGAASATRGDGARRGDRMHGGRGHGHGHAHGQQRGRTPFASLQLTDAQRDKLFEVRHAQAPAMRAQMKELRAARTELRTLAMSDRYDESRAAALTERAAKAQATLALLHARSTNEFYKVLTPEQRQKLEAQRAQRGERGDFRGRRG